MGKDRPIVDGFLLVKENDSDYGRIEITFSSKAEIVASLLRTGL